MLLILTSYRTIFNLKLNTYCKKTISLVVSESKVRFSISSYLIYVRRLYVNIKREGVRLLRLLFSQRYVSRHPPDASFVSWLCVCCRPYFSLFARSGVRSVGSWKMTSWLLCVILLMRMLTRSGRVYRHCQVSRFRLLQIERLLTFLGNLSSYRNLSQHCYIC